MNLVNLVNSVQILLGFLQQMIINRLTKEGTPPPDEKATKKEPSGKKLKPAEA